MIIKTEPTNCSSILQVGVNGNVLYIERFWDGKVAIGQEPYGLRKVWPSIEEALITATDADTLLALAEIRPVFN